VTETAFKCVDAGMRSPFLPWRFNPFVAGGDPRFEYVVGGDYEARGIQAILGFWYRSNDLIVTTVPPPDPPVDIRDPVNQFRGILAYPSLDSFWLRPYGNDPVPGARYLQLEYEIDDVLCVGTPANGGTFLPESISLAAVHVVAEVFR
jgi:hypothetical protein